MVSFLKKDIPFPLFQSLSYSPFFSPLSLLLSLFHSSFLPHSFRRCCQNYFINLKDNPNLAFTAIGGLNKWTATLFKMSCPFAWEDTQCRLHDDHVLGSIGARPGLDRGQGGASQAARHPAAISTEDNARPGRTGLASQRWFLP